VGEKVAARAVKRKIAVDYIAEAFGQGYKRRGKLEKEEARLEYEDKENANLLLGVRLK